MQGTKMNDAHWPSESTLAMNDFASWVRRNRSRFATKENYEVRPCRNVRGVMLRLPVVGWLFWFPSVADAVKFTYRMTPIYSAECVVYDANGEHIFGSRTSQPSFREGQQTDPGPARGGAEKLFSAVAGFAGTTAA
jgi:hypothetical protein